MLLRIVVPLFLLVSSVFGAVVNFESAGAIPNKNDLATCWKNGGLFNSTLAALKPGDTLFIPNSTYWLMGGIYSYGLRDVVIQIDGTLKFSDDQKAWPRKANGDVYECIYIEAATNITFTSSGKGTIDGNGAGWWGVVELLLIKENRPRILNIYNSKQLLVEYILFKDSPYWTFWAHDIADLEIRFSDIDVRRTNLDYHDMYDLTAFNTDGFDVAGKNVYIHDCNIWNDDDCIAVKDQTGAGLQATCSENMLFERINASGVGLTIGSIGASKAHTCVRNITFRDSTMYNTFKGIYMKSRPPADPTYTGEITDVLYENILISEPTQWAIWIGPQQASYQNSCALTWPQVPDVRCYVPSQITWTNIVLRNITILNPRSSPGVIMGNDTNPMKNVVFDNVVVTNPGPNPWGDEYYWCTDTIGYATGGTKPVPPCFTVVGNEQQPQQPQQTSQQGQQGQQGQGQGSRLSDLNERLRKDHQNHDIPWSAQV